MTSTGYFRQEPLDHTEILSLLGIIAPHRPVVVGGQAIAVWASFYEGRDTHLDRLGPLTSRDMDFAENTNAAAALAEALASGRVSKPALADTTPEACRVTGHLGAKRLQVDFMRHVKGVVDKDVVGRPVRLDDTMHEAASIWVLHPLDCLKSRLANINHLHRTDQHTVDQAEAAIRILQLFLLDDIRRGAMGKRRVMKLARELEHVITDLHYVGDTFHHFGAKLQPEQVLLALNDDVHLDARWKALTLSGVIERCQRKASVEINRRAGL